MKKRIKDLIAMKENEREMLEQQSEDAVRAVRNSLDNMNRVNTEIEGKMKEIEDYQFRLTSTKEALGARHQKNQRIIANFKSLLCEE